MCSSCTQVGGPGNNFPHPVFSRASRLRDEFQNNDNNHADYRATTRAAVLPIDAAGPDYMVAEYQLVAGSSCL